VVAVAVAVVAVGVVEEVGIYLFRFLFRCILIYFLFQVVDIMVEVAHPVRVLIADEIVASSWVVFSAA
jgi:hypothetical protein